MIAVPRGAVLGPALPLLTLYVQEGGALLAPVSASFEVFDVSDDVKLLAPVLRTSGSVDLVAHKVPGLFAAGAYALAWTVPGNEPLGKHEVRWAVTTAAGSYAWSEEFDVAVGVLGGAFSSYALPSDLRDEGVPANVTDARLQRALRRAAEYVEKVTRRFFEPRPMQLDLDGTGTPELRLDLPVMALGAAVYLLDGGDETIALSDLRVYNRWLRQGLTSPDDRDDPRVGWARGQTRPLPHRGTEYPEAAWRRGRQNVRLTGLFGYTEPDGSPTGKTPSRIREVTRMLAMRELPKAWSESEELAEEKGKHRILSQTTRDQSYTLQRDARLGASGGGAEFTGDPDIDGVLAEFMAPPFVGSTG